MTRASLFVLNAAIVGGYGERSLRCSRLRPVVWNHGGSIEDLAQRMIVSLVAPASTYFHDVVDLAARRPARWRQPQRGRRVGSRRFGLAR